MATLLPPSADDALYFDKEDTVTLIIGPEKRELLAHGNFIARHSELFQAALKKEWQEGKTRTITMPEDDHETMTRYLSFVYGKKLPTTHLSESVRHDLIGPGQRSLADLYVLGTRLLDKSMKNAALGEVVRLSVITCPGSETVNTIYSGTCEGNPARRLMVNLYAKHACTEWLAPEFSQTFLLELAQKLLSECKAGGFQLRGSPINIAQYLV
jgi:hypothetical protein